MGTFKKNMKIYKQTVNIKKWLNVTTLHTKLQAADVEKYGMARRWIAG